VAVAEHLERLRLGTPEWNRWRTANPSVVPDFSEGHLQHVRLSGANLTAASFRATYLGDADLAGADLANANLAQAYLRGARLTGATLTNASLIEAELSGADLSGARLAGADLSAARLSRANLSDASLAAAILRDADLRQAIAVGTDFQRADLSGCRVYGIAAWHVNLHEAMQRDLIITPDAVPAITTDNLAVAQFLFLLLDNANVRDVIETVGKKSVLILGRFTTGRKAILEAIRTALRHHGWIPILFDGDAPQNRDLTETISALAHLSRAIVVDLTDARSVPQELMAIVPALPSVPVQPILADGEIEYATYAHLARYPWVAEVFRYSSAGHLTTWLVERIGAVSPDGGNQSPIARQR
jgi:uncharacterized protein YjbI with pentapeptide repeats